MTREEEKRFRWLRVAAGIHKLQQRQVQWQVSRAREHVQVLVRHGARLPGWITRLGSARAATASRSFREGLPLREALLAALRIHNQALADLAPDHRAQWWRLIQLQLVRERGLPAPVLPRGCISQESPDDVATRFLGVPGFITCALNFQDFLPPFSLVEAENEEEEGLLWFRE